MTNRATPVCPEGGDDFKAALARSRRQADSRQQRRGVAPAQVAARGAAYGAKERETMGQFQDIVGAHGGERMHIPRRE
jgi:hypothetical protein